MSKVRVDTIATQDDVVQFDVEEVAGLPDKIVTVESRITDLEIEIENVEESALTLEDIHAAALLF